MITLGKNIRTLTIVLLLVQLCLPVTVSVCFSDYLSMSEASQAGIMCTHADADSGHDSQDSHDQTPHCHFLDAPCDIMPGIFVKHSPSSSPLTASYKGTLQPGYGALIEIPPKRIA